jgi:hypothetical protein
VENNTEGEPDTKRVGGFPKGASPYSLLDMTRQRAKWTDSALGLPLADRRRRGGCYLAGDAGGSWSACQLRSS